MSSARQARWPRIVVRCIGILAALTTTVGCAVVSGDAADPPGDRSDGQTESDGTPAPGSSSDEAPGLSSDEPEAAAIRAGGTPVPLGRSTIWILVTAGADGSDGSDAVTVTSPSGAAASGGPAEVTITGVPATGDEQPTVYLAGPEGTTPERLLDGSLVLRDGDGVAVAGADAPVGRVEGGSAAYYDPRVEHTAVVLPSPAGATGEETASGAGPAASGASDGAAATATLTLRLSVSAIASATWGENEGGRSLAVVPTDWLRAGSLAAQEVGWSQLVARDGEVDTATMRNQYDCHALGARAKASWNLEPWRPDVGVFEVLAAHCNPT